MNDPKVQKANIYTTICALVAMVTSAIKIYTGQEIRGVTEFAMGLMVCGLFYLLRLSYKNEKVTRQYYLTIGMVYIFVILFCWLVAAIRVFVIPN